MSDLPERPAIRPVEVKEIDLKGQRGFWLKDPLRLSDAVLVVPPVGLAVWELLDGTRTLRDVARAFEERYGFEIGIEPIRTLVGAPAGGTSDILVRLVGGKLAETWGQQVISDPRPGANGNIGRKQHGFPSQKELPL